MEGEISMKKSILVSMFMAVTVVMAQSSHAMVGLPDKMQAVLSCAEAGRTDTGTRVIIRTGGPFKMMEASIYQDGSSGLLRTSRVLVKKSRVSQDVTGEHGNDVILYSGESFALKVGIGAPLATGPVPSRIEADVDGYRYNTELLCQAMYHIQ
jgi:hypothetical protein